MTQLSTLASSWSSLTWHNPLWLHLVLQNHNETETDRAHIQHYRWTSRKKDFHFTFVALKKHWDHCAHSQEDYFKEDDKPLPFFSLTSLGIFLHHLKLLHIQSPKHLDKLYLMHIFTTNSIHLLLFFFSFFQLNSQLTSPKAPRPMILSISKSSLCNLCCRTNVVTPRSENNNILPQHDTASSAMIPSQKVNKVRSIKTLIKRQEIEYSYWPHRCNEKQKII